MLADNVSLMSKKQADLAILIGRLEVSNGAHDDKVTILKDLCKGIGDLVNLLVPPTIPVEPVKDRFKAIRRVGKDRADECSVRDQVQATKETSGEKTDLMSDVQRLKSNLAKMEDVSTIDNAISATEEALWDDMVKLVKSICPMETRIKCIMHGVTLVEEFAGMFGDSGIMRSKSKLQNDAHVSNVISSQAPPARAPEVFQRRNMSTMLDTTECKEEITDGAPRLSLNLGRHRIAALAHDLVDYKGDLVAPSWKQACEHIVDDMKDHFSCDHAPEIVCLPPTLKRLPYDEKYKSKINGPCDTWYSRLFFSYNVAGKPTDVDFIAVDHVYLDLKPKFNHQRGATLNYGATWINVYFRKETMKKIEAMLRQGTGYGMNWNTVTVDARQDLVSVAASMSIDKAPKFVTVTNAGEFAGDSKLQNHDTISSVFSRKDKQHIYECTAFFTVAICVPGVVGCRGAPEPDTLAKYKFHLDTVKVFGISRHVTPITFG